VLPRETFDLIEHRYPDNRSGLPGFGKHYVVLAHEIADRNLGHCRRISTPPYRWVSAAAALADRRRTRIRRHTPGHGGSPAVVSKGR
jgi:hypothetical protein